MSVQAAGKSRARVALAVLAAALLAACDASTRTTAPLMPAQAQLRAIEGDTLQCRKGWIIVQGRYVCNDDS